ncbi:MAG: SpoIIIAH-like family protein [Sedimentibacter sp.]|uniref:SpoIIIAH-like family protein n=1 Tax=Sedimentibacter sp. TaxID=1960295 RepID=UPI0031588D0D
MIMKKETLVFITSLAIIFIIGYVNLTMAPENAFDADDYAQVQNDSKDDIAEFVEGETKGEEASSEETAAETAQGEQSEEPGSTDYEILGDITDITDLNAAQASSSGVLGTLSASFSNFKLNKEKANMDVLDHLEENLSNATLSEETKNQFEALLVKKNTYIETEQDIELMLQSKGYNETVVIVDSDAVKVVTNEDIQQADATKILDVIVSETEYKPSQIKIVKFDNIDL